MVGLYLDPPENALVLCVDEKSRIQALERTAPILPMQPHLIERRSHDYRRHGTTTLFAALEIATGKVTARCQDRHRHHEFLVFLRQVARAYPGVELHLVLDNYAAQAPRRQGLAGGEPAGARPLHPDPRVMDEHGRDLVLDG